MASTAAIRAGRAYVELLADSSKFVRGLKQAEARLKDFGERAQVIGRQMSMMGGAVLLPLAAAGKLFADVGDDLNKMSARTGLSVEALSELGFAAKQSGSDLNAVAEAILKMNRRIGRLTAGEGTATQAAAVQELGLSLEELEGMNPEQQFMALADAIAGYGNQAQAAGLAQRAFGTGVDKLLPLLAEGKSGIEELRAEARRLGIVITEEQAALAAKFTDQMSRLAEVLKMAVFSAGAGLADTFGRWTATATELASKLGGVIERNRELIAGVASVSAGVLAAGVAFQTLGFAVKGFAVAVGGATTAVKGLGAALTFVTAHPAVAAVAVAGALTTALVAVSSHTADVRHETEQLTAANDRARAKDREKLDRLEQLAQKEELTAEQMRESRTLIAELNQDYGKLGLTLNDTAGRIEGMAGAWDRLNKEQKQSKIRDLQAEIAEAQLNLDELAEQREKGTLLGTMRRVGGMLTSWGGEGGAEAQQRAAERSGLRMRQERKRLSDLRMALRRLEEGGAGGEAAGEPTTSERMAQQEQVARYDESLDRRLQEERIKQIEDRKARELAAIDLKYEYEKKKAEEAGADLERLENLRIMEREAVKEKHDRRRREKEDQREAEVAAEQQRLRDELDRRKIQAGEGTEQEKAIELLKLEREQALRGTDRANRDLVNKLYDFRERAIREGGPEGRMAVRDPVGTFSARAARMIGMGGGAAERTADATEETAENTRQMREDLALGGASLEWEE